MERQQPGGWADSIRRINRWDIVCALAALAVLVGAILRITGVAPVDSPCFGDSRVCLW